MAIHVNGWSLISQIISQSFHAHNGASNFFRFKLVVLGLADYVRQSITTFVIELCMIYMGTSRLLHFGDPFMILHSLELLLLWHLINSFITFQFNLWQLLQVRFKSLNGCLIGNPLAHYLIFTSIFPSFRWWFSLLFDNDWLELRNLTRT